MKAVIVIGVLGLVLIGLFIVGGAAVRVVQEWFRR